MSYGKTQDKRSQMERALEGINLDSPARVGATLFQKGVPVLDVIRHAQSDWKYSSSGAAITPLASTGDPWVAHIYAVTTKYHIDSGKKIVIHDLLDDFMASSIKDVAEDDRELFEKRIMERMS